MFKTNLSHIYVTRDSFSRDMDVWDPNIGIKKFDGCCFFCSAKSPDGCMHYGNGNLAYDVSCADLGLTKFIPAGTAWLVDTCSGVWTRIDQTMYLLNVRGDIIC